MEETQNTDITNIHEPEKENNETKEDKLPEEADSQTQEEKDSPRTETSAKEKKDTFLFIVYTLVLSFLMAASFIGVYPEKTKLSLIVAGSLALLAIVFSAFLYKKRFDAKLFVKTQYLVATLGMILIVSHYTVNFIKI